MILRILGAALALATCASFGPQQGHERADDRRPNFVIFLADDAGVECFGAYGGESYATPRIDGLAREGVRFDHAHSQPLCTPSRVKLLTGRSNLRNYVHFSILDPAETTFAHVLEDAGYATGIAGKWQLYGAEHYDEWAARGASPRGAGFDEWCLWQVARLGSRYHDPRLDTNGVERVHVGEFGPHLVRDWCQDFIARHADEPFCLYVPTALPHDPFVNVPGAERSADKQVRFRGMIETLDGIVGDVVDCVDAHGLGENTLVLFMGDNGTSRSITSRRNGVDVRGGKRLTTDAGTHVPFIARWTGRIEAGEVADDLVDLSDVAPTLASLAGTSFPESIRLDGLDLAPRLLRSAPLAREALLCWSNPRPGNPKFEVHLWARDRRFKLYRDGRLYDVVEDPLEKAPLQHVRPGAHLMQALAHAPAPPPWLAEGGPPLDWRSVQRANSDQDSGTPKPNK